jgi:excisionase family DNA binding protein
VLERASGAMFLNEKPPMSMIGGKCACLRAKMVDISGHLPLLVHSMATIPHKQQYKDIANFVYCGICGLCGIVAIGTRAKVYGLCGLCVTILAILTESEGNMIVPQEEVFYTIKEAAQILRVSDETIRRMINTGQLEAIRVRGGLMGRGQWRIRRESLDTYVERKDQEEE